MKILIIGATGNSGRRLLSSALQEGHTVTVYVRNEGKLLAQAQGSSLPLPQIVVGDVFDQASLARACRGQDAVINASGNVADGEQFVELVAIVSRAAEEGLGAGGRFWFFGGAAALDVPGTNLMTVNLPKIPATFQAHEQNYNRVKSTGLNWSMLCPGPMTDAPDGKADEGLRISTDSWPVARPGVTKILPGIATSLAFKRKMPELTISYEDAAKVILDNLAPDSPLAGKRVGVALPQGIRRTKDITHLTN